MNLFETFCIFNMRKIIVSASSVRCRSKYCFLFQYSHCCCLFSRGEYAPVKVKSDLFSYFYCSMYYSCNPFLSIVVKQRWVFALLLNKDIELDHWENITIFEIPRDVFDQAESLLYINLINKTIISSFLFTDFYQFKTRICVNRSLTTVAFLCATTMNRQLNMDSIWNKPNQCNERMIKTLNLIKIAMA